MHCTSLFNYFYDSVGCCSDVTRCRYTRILHNDWIWDLLFRDRVFLVAELYHAKCLEELCVSSYDS